MIFRFGFRLRISRSTAGTAFVGGALILTLTALAYPSMMGVENAASGQDRIIANTQWGPLTEDSMAEHLALILPATAR